MKKLSIAGLLLSVVLQGTCFASGMLIPKDRSLAPMAIKHQRVNIEIKDGVATANIEQVFKNNVNRDLEAIYVFPLPENASIADFAMYINGKRESGELVEKGKARKIYQDIVRRMKDPGLLEHMGGNLFRVSVYPVPKMGEQKIEIAYSQTLDFQAGLYKYIYPLRTDRSASRTQKDFTVKVRLESGLPIKNIYSPSHKVGVSRNNEHEAVIGFEEEQALLDKDFVLYYGVSKKDFGLNLLTHAVKGHDGFFMMMLSPTVVPPKSAIINKDIVFVADTSGSMSGKKMKQAREALKYCVEKLNNGDRFNIVRFSTDVESFKESLIEVSDKTKKDALEFIGELEARGGTDIDGALREAVGMEFDKKTPNIIAFMTDGKPTIGEDNPKAIVSNIDKGNNANARIFVFGVGEEVNIHLLDKISGSNGGISQYVKPNEDIEVKLSSFADKMSNPVLANLKIDMGKLKVKQLHPRTLPDLFCGDQVTVFGRYEGDGHVAVTLTGDVDGKDKKFVYEGSFAEEIDDNEFIPRLWATRRVGYLLDEIRLRGEKGELKEEVIRLSKEYGIMTPYTSYLVLENDRAYNTHGIDRRKSGESPGRRWAKAPKKSVPRPAAEPQAFRHEWGVGAGPPAEGAVRQAEVAAKEEAERRRAPVPVFDAGAADDAEGLDMALSTKGVGDAKRAGGKYKLRREEKKDIADYFAKESGRQAIELSEAINRYKRADMAAESSAAVKHVGKKMFYYINGQWVDSKFKKDMKLIKVKFAGDEYFKLLADKPHLKKFLAIGNKLTVVIDDKTAVMVE